MGNCLNKLQNKKKHQQQKNFVQIKDNGKPLFIGVASGNDFLEENQVKRKIVITGERGNDLITPCKIPNKVGFMNEVQKYNEDNQDKLKQINEVLLENPKRQSLTISKQNIYDTYEIPKDQNPFNYNDEEPQQQPLQLIKDKMIDGIMEGNEDDYFGPDESEYANRNKLASIILKNHDKIKWVPSELIGQGSFGKVCMGMNKVTGQVIAVKQVELKEDNLIMDAEVLFYFQSYNKKIKSLEIEIDLLSRLQHKNIVSYYGMEQTKKHINIFLEYVAGGSLLSMLRKFGKFKESLVKVYMKEILEGLIYLHDNGVVHRDIKSANILVDSSGVCKLADFGSSKKLSQINNVEINRSIQGTPNYMAPEIVTQQNSGRKSDIWSLGCTMIELITGKPPWNDFQNAISIMIKIARTQEPPELPSNISAEAKDFLYHCLQIDPQKRWTARRLLEHHFFLNQNLLKAGSSPKKRIQKAKSPANQIKKMSTEQLKPETQRAPLFVQKSPKSLFREDLSVQEPNGLGVTPSNIQQNKFLNFDFDLDGTSNNHSYVVNRPSIDSSVNMINQNKTSPIINDQEKGPFKPDSQNGLLWTDQTIGFQCKIYINNNDPPEIDTVLNNKPFIESQSENIIISSNDLYVENSLHQPLVIEKSGSNNNFQEFADVNNFEQSHSVFKIKHLLDLQSCDQNQVNQSDQLSDFDISVKLRSAQRIVTLDEEPRQMVNFQTYVISNIVPFNKSTPYFVEQSNSTNKVPGSQNLERIHSPINFNDQQMDELSQAIEN